MFDKEEKNNEGLTLRRRVTIGLPAGSIKTGQSQRVIREPLTVKTMFPLMSMTTKPSLMVMIFLTIARSNGYGAQYWGLITAVVIVSIGALTKGKGCCAG